MTGLATIQESQAETIPGRQDLLTLRARHDELYSTFIHKGPESKEERYRVQVKRLLRDMQDMSPMMPSLDDYLHLRAAVEQWRKAGPAIGVSVSDIVLVPPSSERLSLKHPFEQPVWTDSSLTTWLAFKAAELNVYRAIEWRDHMPVEEIVRQFQETISPDAARRQAEYDWEQAELYLVCDVLDGRFDLVRGLSSSSYYRLEGQDGRMWLSKVKNLKGYFNWKARRKGWDENAAKEDYYNASKEILNQLCCGERKAPQSTFEPIEKHIKDYFLTGPILDTSKERTARWLEAKSERLLERQDVKDLESARKAANEQMKNFYENITKAVLGVDEASTRLVAEALGLYPGFEHYEAMVNCFEMAIAIYYLDPVITQRVLSESISSPPRERKARG